MPIDIGKTAEYKFAAEILSRNLVPCWPSSAHYPFDLVVASASRTYRVQIKATQKLSNSITIATQMRTGAGTRAYTHKDCEFIAIYLFERKLWYIVPIKAVKTKGIYIRPEDPRCRYAKYKEAWSLLE